MNAHNRRGSDQRSAERVRQCQRCINRAAGRKRKPFPSMSLACMRINALLYAAPRVVDNHSHGLRRSAYRLQHWLKRKLKPCEASAALPPRAVTFSDVGVVLSSLVDAQAGRFGRARTTQTVGRPGRTNNRHQRFAFAAGNCFLANNNPQPTLPFWAGRASRTLGSRIALRPWRPWLLLTADQHKA